MPLYLNHSKKLRTPCLLSQKFYKKSVGDPPTSPDTPGISYPDETRHLKSYAEAIRSKDTNKSTVAPLGPDDTAWTPLANMVIDPPPKTFVLRKDPVPPGKKNTYTTPTPHMHTHLSKTPKIPKTHSINTNNTNV